MSNWVIRNTAPASTNPWYRKTTYGGYNRAILINSATGECIPNCVGYAFGRFMEGVGATECNLSVGDASTFWGRSDGYPRGQTPKPGAVACWGGGRYWDNYQQKWVYGQGHVAIVEQVIDANTIITSESSYSGSRWYTKTRYRGGDGNWGLGGYYYCQGFIYNPWVDGGVIPGPVDPGDDQDQPTPSGGTGLPIWMMIPLKKRKGGGI